MAKHLRIEGDMHNPKLPLSKVLAVWDSHQSKRPQTEVLGEERAQNVRAADLDA